MEARVLTARRGSAHGTRQEWHGGVAPPVGGVGGPRSDGGVGGPWSVGGAAAWRERQPKSAGTMQLGMPLSVERESMRSLIGPPLASLSAKGLSWPACQLAMWSRRSAR